MKIDLRNVFSAAVCAFNFLLPFADGMKSNVQSSRVGVHPSTNSQHDEYDDAYDADLRQGNADPFESPSKTRQALSLVKLVNCLEQGMTVSLRKSQVRVSTK